MCKVAEKAELGLAQAVERNWGGKGARRIHFGLVDLLVWVLMENSKRIEQEWVVLDLDRREIGLVQA